MTPARQNRRNDDDVAELARYGADPVFHLYGSAGFAPADHAARC